MSLALSVMKPVLCVGCAVIDFVTVNSTFPQEDSDQRCLDGFFQRGGNASNVSTVLKILGANVEFFGMLSDSPAFGILLEDLRKRKIASHHCPRTDIDPPFSTVILAKDTGTRTIVHCNKNFPYVTVEDFKKIDLSKIGWCHFEARNAKETIQMIRLVRDYNNGRGGDKIPISLDLESKFEEHIDMASMCDYVVVSKDIADGQGWTTIEEACSKIDSAFRLPRKFDLHRPAVICPWGKEGAGCLDIDNTFTKLRPYKQPKVVDTLGAGDAFMAAFIYAIYVKDKFLTDAVDFANRVASHKISKFGYDHIDSIPRHEVKPLNFSQIAQAAEEDEEELSEFMQMCKKYLHRTIEHSPKLKPPEEVAAQSADVAQQQQLEINMLLDK